MHNLMVAEMILAARLPLRALLTGLVLGAAALSLALATPGSARADEECERSSERIQVIVENVRSSDGLITAVLYDDNPENFLKKGQRVDRIRVEAEAGETHLCLGAPATGNYTIALYHDENGNKKFDKNFLGIPNEGYGFSNNPGFRFGKPDHEETLFKVNGSSTTVRISVLYL